MRIQIKGGVWKNTEVSVGLAAWQCEVGQVEVSWAWMQPR